MSVLRRAGIPLLLLAGALQLAAQPSVVTIEDTIYKADGTRFDGFAFIEWRSFESGNGFVVANQSIVSRIANGVLRVSLTPTANARPRAYYQVKFNSDGRIQFTEYWAVPVSSAPLRLRDVRLASPPDSTGSSQGLASPLAQIGDIDGLQAALNERPTRGPAYLNSRAAVINASGSINGAAGNLTDCLRVDGTPAPCMAGGPGFTDGETPAGVINGVNTTFTLAALPNPAASLSLYRNGALQAAPGDYTLSGTAITFAGASVPRAGDSLRAFYRLNATTPTGSAGGHLTGFYPDPAIAGGVISDFNVAPSAGIRESKLALNHPTHTNTYDPTAAEKSALAGTAGVPSAANRFVTHEDTRLSDPRMPLGHGLLDGRHGDTLAASPVRGDLVVAQGTAALWTRLPLGAANRCLNSNGADAVWNACLFTGFGAGTVPVVDSAGNLSAPPGGLRFDAANSLFSVGTAAFLSTAYFHDDRIPAGRTTVVVRGSPNQSNEPLQRWLASDASELASISSGGRARFQGLETRTTADWAGFRDPGGAADPVGRANGDAWFHTGQQARKTFEAGQIHTQAQVLCSASGTQTSSTGTLGSCMIPAAFLAEGDRIEIRFHYEHTGTVSNWSFGVNFGPDSVTSAAVDKAETLLSGRSDGARLANRMIWGNQSYGTTVFAFRAASRLTSTPPATAFRIDFLGTVSTPGADTVRLSNFTVIRYPAVSNPN